MERKSIPHLLEEPSKYYFTKKVSHSRMFRHVFTPILDRYGVLQQDRPYIMAFYIRGLMAIISEWLKNDCNDSITYVTGVIQQCVKMPQSETTNAV
ncbi:MULTISPECIES: TetR-like C-terminal domain-containing protein [Lachnospiraceae]|uniref:TetR-like C-terminal domain-containing protein n=1 Tax=Lachnospiraceae TaxID=186803 RepID=UPI002FE6D016